ncbi:MAG: esterase family protein [Bacteroidetes bacterium]|jgi:enterochelin esterase-like enzyme|nr:esterase family protein [Bacteroidota bacterium]MBT3749906.1 esterase family protein [Bacteroidota bacterium]MBT4401165.1 esterase family protein [Bacteroidota bacterium]MBT4411200.1 esterase family protein [Bacteroidota bacterium]MBT5425239.1 esterase family protein [Bacteroidota bacterium]
MKNLLLSLILGFLLVLPSVAQTGKVYDDLSVKSEILDSERKFAIYLPPDYETSERSYPVLYLLHGAGDDQSGWVQFGEVLHITDQAIKAGKATPMIIVMPDANRGQRGYFNSISGDWRYEDFFFEELMPYVEKTYRIKGEKRYRAVAGLSMGGGGSFMYALHHPELFSSACPLSAYIGPLSFDEFSKRFARNAGGISKADQQSYFEAHSALSLIENTPAKVLKTVRWFIDCGDDDFLYEGNSLVHIALRKKEVAHEYRVRDGGHSWTYWRASLPVVLEFISDAFHQH